MYINVYTVYNRIHCYVCSAVRHSLNPKQSFSLRLWLSLPFIPRSRGDYRIGRLTAKVGSPKLTARHGHYIKRWHNPRVTTHLTIVTNVTDIHADVSTLPETTRCADRTHLPETRENYVSVSRTDWKGGDMKVRNSGTEKPAKQIKQQFHQTVGVR